VFRKRNFNFWLLATFCGMFGYLIPIVNIVSVFFRKVIILEVSFID